ncbi:MAG: succinate dehydrogenase/fumarate reductase iron-sulfur subunit, partial [Ekhidna sp.]|nr:succinate dehydrogenase/fumarate reductase iron-sulfur subunit [Ekhidna sp.]
MNLTLNVWRQNGPEDKGRLESYKVDNISPDSSFLEMMDILNEQLINEGKEPVEFD